MVYPGNVEFVVMPKQLIFHTQVDGDKITVMNITFNAEQAATVAYLINQPKPLRIEITKEE